MNASSLNRNRWTAGLLLICLLTPLSALAHTDGHGGNGLVSGLTHPVSGPDHMLAMVAVGLWGAQLGRPAIWLLPVAFPVVMAFGGFLGLIGVNLPFVEIGIAVSGVALGAMVLLEARPPLWAAALLVGLFAIFHGHAHGAELPEGDSGLLYSIGFVISTGCLHACGITIGLLHRWPAGKVLLRAAGACVALGGCYFLWNALA